MAKRKGEGLGQERHCPNMAKRKGEGLGQERHCPNMAKRGTGMYSHTS